MRRPWLLRCALGPLWLVLAALAAPALQAAAADELRAGFAVVPLPAPDGAPLGGYGGLRDRTASGMHDPPEARAVVLEQGPARIGLVSLDIVIVRPELRRDVIERLQDVGLDLVSMLATHTHSGPGGYIDAWLAERITAGSFDSALRNGLVRAAEEALRKAAGDLRPVTTSSTTQSLDLAVNRRWRGGPRETDLPVLVFEPLDGSKPIVLFSYGAHPTVRSPRNRAYSADYVGAARQWLEQAGVRPIFAAGAMGDQRPESALGPSWPEDVEAESPQVTDIGTRLGQSVLAGVRSAHRGSDHLQYVEKRATLPRLQFRRFCALWWLSPLVGRSARSILSQEVPVQALSIGRIPLVALPAEPSSSVAEQIRAREPTPVVIAHANDWVGYVVDREAYARGGYEACLSFHGPELGTWLVERARETLDLLDGSAQ